MTSLIEVLAQRAAETPERPAILAPSGRSTAYAELHAQVVRLREQLSAAAITADCAVALALPNGPELAVAFLGAMTAAAGAPLAAERPVAEHERDLAAMGASLLVVQHGHDTPARAAAAALGIPLLEIDPEHTRGCVDRGSAAPSQPGGGSRARRRPGRAPPLHVGHHEPTEAGAVVGGEPPSSAANVAAVLDLTADDRCLNVMPLFHIHGLVAALLASLAAGGSVVCTPGFHGAQSASTGSRSSRRPGTPRCRRSTRRCSTRPRRPRGTDALDAPVRPVVVGRAAACG